MENYLLCFDNGFISVEKSAKRLYSFPEIILPMAQNIKEFMSGCAFVPAIGLA